MRTATQTGTVRVRFFASYAELVPAFRALLAQKRGDLAAFYDAARGLERLEKPERDARLAALAAR